MKVFFSAHAKLELEDTVDFYELLYSIEKDHLFVIAVAHQHRKPDYWLERQ